MGRDSSAGIALGYGLDDRGSRVRFPAGAGNFSLHHRVQTGSGAHPPFCPMDTRGSFSGRKAACGVKLTTHLRLMPRSRMHGAISTLPNTSSWRGALLSTGTTLPLPFFLPYKTLNLRMMWITKMKLPMLCAV
jgi:hypothetical protein